MKVFLPPLEIGADEGFSPDKDLFGRKEFGDGLTRLITNVDDPLVIALDGQWGSGKTTFLKMWAGELRKQSYPVVFFDAFANDYMSDAFLAIAGQIIALADEKKKSDNPKTKEFVNKAKRAGKVLLRSSLKIGLKAATLGALDGDELDGVTKDLIKDIAKEASDLEDKYIGELLTRQAQEKDAIEQFKSALGQLSESLAEETQTGENSAQKLKKPLVFIVDELDRCRPDFALSLLERIKHFFLVDNVHVIIGVNFQQLYSSVRLCYGHDVDADYNLQKFFHLKLEINHELGYAQSAEKYIKFLIDQLDVQHHPRSYHIQCLVLSAAQKRNLSFRTLERIMSYICLSLAFNFANEFSPIAIGLVIMKVSAPELYSKARQQKLELNEALTAIGLANLELHSDSICRYARALWDYSLTGQIAEEYASELTRIKNNMDGKNIIKIVLNNVTDRLVLNGQ